MNTQTIYMQRRQRIVKQRRLNNIKRTLWAIFVVPLAVAMTYAALWAGFAITIGII